LKKDAKKIHRGVEQLSDFTTVNRRLYFTSLLAVIVGIISAFVAVALLELINFFTNLFFYGKPQFSLKLVSPAENHLGALVIIVPIVGSLIVGVMARYGSERIRGHGIPEALESILITRSKMEPKIAILKPVSTAISIGSGGPFGAEGPIIMTGGAFGSVFAQFLKLTSMERKTLLVAGAAGGMAAVFNSPVAAVLISVELLLFEWKPRSLIPVGIASVTATIFRGIFIGSGPLFPIASTPVPNVSVLLFSIVVGVCCGFLSTVLTYMVYSAEDAFRKLPIHWMWWPAIGAIAIGVGGFFAPHALGVGYDTIGLLLGSPDWIVGVAGISLTAIITLLIAKSIMWSVALGSGTSGGVLAPLLIMGGSLGAILALVAPAGPSALWVLVCMGAVLGGTMRSPFTGVIFSLELTHDVNALFPLLIAALFSEFVTVFTMKRSILTEKVARRGVHVAREYSVDVLELIPVRAVMHKNIHTVEADAPLEELIEVVRKTGKSTEGYPIVDAIGNLQGFLTRSDVLEYMAKVPSGENIRVRELAKSPVMVAFPDEPLRVAADRMAMIGSDSIPVVDTIDDQKVIGLISREDLFNARVLWFAEEKQRESFLSLPMPPVSRFSFYGISKMMGRRKQKPVSNEISNDKNNGDDDDEKKTKNDDA
jgi:CIC family chloride channel protein